MDEHEPRWERGKEPLGGERFIVGSFGPPPEGPVAIRATEVRYKWVVAWDVEPSADGLVAREARDYTVTNPVPIPENVLEALDAVVPWALLHTDPVRCPNCAGDGKPGFATADLCGVIGEGLRKVLGASVVSTITESLSRAEVKGMDLSHPPVGGIPEEGGDDGD